MPARIALEPRLVQEILGANGLAQGQEVAGATDGKAWFGSGPKLSVRSPIDGTALATVQQASADDYERVVAAAHAAFLKWREVPAPQRADLVRHMGDALRKRKDSLGRLVTLENGKILTEGHGEVQEMIDIADFAVGLGRNLGGMTLQSERLHHRMYEQWHPLGVVGIITAFNFPTAVWSWNSFLAAVCGDSMVWKPSSNTPLTAIVATRICNEVLAKHSHEGVMTLLVGKGEDVGERLLHDQRVPLVSATGSTAVGARVYRAVAERMGRCLLELGGNNGVVVSDSANLDLAVRAITFGAIGTAGQRCTSVRRVIAHEAIADELTRRLVKAYQSARLGDPFDAQTLVGPLITERAVTTMMEAIGTAQKQGGRVLVGGKARPDLGPHYVEPTIVEASPAMAIVQEETFAPLLYVQRYRTLDEAIALHNGVPQGLSSSIISERLREVERFLSVAGSDCGIANVNQSTSGAEIGGAFGGEKDTGGGREAGSDAWKQYMRRQTVTINWGEGLPLAQGVRFDV
ncbi:MAG TPA: aldehyde dehydrogenase family protein [Candidatus Thermoplasmatota archaeon]|jgi:aldehyde dehydrogenase (NAD+)|nr:aldehyde dehydrogenase family protein [Candidatus Thermoplasmatota archaeon]